MLTLFLEMTRNILFLSSSLWPLPDLKKWKKFLHWQGFHSVESTHKFLVTLHIVVGPQLFATTVVVKQMAIALKNLVILIVGKDVKFFSHYNVKLFFIFCASPNSSSSQTSGHSTCREDVLIHMFAPIQGQHKFSHKHALNTCRSSCHHMSATLHCSLKLNLVFTVTRRCSPLRGPSSSSCGGLRPRPFFCPMGKQISFYFCFG